MGALEAERNAEAGGEPDEVLPLPLPLVPFRCMIEGRVSTSSFRPARGGAENEKAEDGAVVEVEVEGSEAGGPQMIGG